MSLRDVIDLYKLDFAGQNNPSIWDQETFHVWDQAKTGPQNLIATGCAENLITCFVYWQLRSCCFRAFLVGTTNFSDPGINPVGGITPISTYGYFSRRSIDCPPQPPLGL